MSTPAEPEAPQGAVLDGRYQLQSPLGTGTVGEVYRAEHLWMHKTVAIKLLRPEVTSSEEAVKRFAREARLASLIEDPHCVSVYDFAQTPNGIYYLAMEYLEGESLFALLRRQRRLPIDLARSLFLQILDALSAAHKLDIIHRDMKPENVMLLDRGEKHPFVKILDFGIAKTAAPPEGGDGIVTRVGFTVGTPEYMSPEQATAVDVDARADLYSTGIMLFECLTGKRPFTGSQVEVATAHVFKAPPKPSDLAPELTEHPELEAVILRAIEKEPAKRFSSAAEFADALRAALPDPSDPRGFTPASLPALSPAEFAEAMRLAGLKSAKPPGTSEEKPATNPVATPPVMATPAPVVAHEMPRGLGSFVGGFFSGDFWGGLWDGGWSAHDKLGRLFALLGLFVFLLGLLL
jgi:eukaryotic-like serine/threonine-protein kinase